MTGNPKITAANCASGQSADIAHAAADDRSEVPVIVIEQPSRWPRLNLGEIWRYQELLYILTWRDIKVRYKQTVIGAAWAILQPFLTMVVFTVVFQRFINVPSDNTPYPVFSYAALLPWTFFSTALSRASGSLVNNPGLISKVYFPRLMMPTAAVLAALVDFGIAFVVLLGMMVYYGVTPGWAILALPLFLVLAFITTHGVGLWLAALNVKYRDIGYVIPFLTQFWLFVTPVAYPSSVVPEQWRLLYGLNPMAGVIEGFRWSLLGQPNRPDALVMMSVVVATTVFIGGLFWFRHAEDEFADVV